jgi:NADPH:quinone reductase-like Zn-dependent oxidoreductase
MKAIVQDGYGSPDVLQLAEIGKPVIKPTEVLVRVRAAGVNPLDWFGVCQRPLGTGSGTLSVLVASQYGRALERRGWGRHMG